MARDAGAELLPDPLHQVRQAPTDMELLIDRMSKTKDNTEFLSSMADAAASMASAGSRRR